MATTITSPRRVPYEIIDLIIRYSTLEMYYTYTQVSATFRRLVYKQLTPIPYTSILHSNPSHRNLIIHLLNNQKPPSRSANTTYTDDDNIRVIPHKTEPDEIFAPECSLDEWFGGVKYVTMVGEALEDWKRRTGKDTLGPTGGSGDDGVDLVRSLGYYHRNPSSFVTFMIVDYYLDKV